MKIPFPNDQSERKFVQTCSILWLYWTKSKSLRVTNPDGSNKECFQILKKVNRYDRH